MRKWLGFLVVPMLLIWVLELIAAVVLGGFFALDTDSIWGLVAAFCIYFIGGVTVFHFTPGYNMVLSYVLAAIYVGSSVYLGVITDGNVVEFMGEQVAQEFLILPEVAKAVGIFSGIWGARQGEIEESQKTT